MIEPIAVVGMACEYPEARTPAELWENLLAQRRAFRLLPPERLRVEDYYAADPNVPDRTYAVEAALIEGYEFDRVGFRVAGSTFRAVDPAHWLALDVAARALADAGFEGKAAHKLPRETTGVFLGNTLTGDSSRADVLRLRWPYVRRVLDASLRDEPGWSVARRSAFLSRLEEQYKAPFPPVGDETLAGGLSNTIAGRICNHFDLKGGGYTIDGARASSLLAIAQACAALTVGDLDVALAGGVDLSIDPFELVGFAKVGALAADEMRIYDARSAGFWPGEGCGMVVLMRQSDARARGLRGDVVIRGWGISSDGQGGITRPEVEGQVLALRRAYRRAGVGIETVAYFEGHGTGTSVGDATELRALTRARREAANAAGTALTPAAIGSIKANIGHTKAAAGVAGVIKAALAVSAQVLPPTTGCEVPHPELNPAPGDPAPALRVLREGEPWPEGSPLRVGVSAMGFGGINAHLVLEGTAPARSGALGPRVRALGESVQDAELFLLSARDSGALRERVDSLREIARGMARSELADLAVTLAGTLDAGPLRAAVVAGRPSALADRLDTLGGWLASEGEGVPRLDLPGGIFLGSGSGGQPPRIGFLFPGQGVPTERDGGALCRRFASARALWDETPRPGGSDLDGQRTENAQPAIVAASLAALRVLDELGIEASLAIGHSLGELTALGWAGALEDSALLRIAAARGQAMAGLADIGAMASLTAPGEAVEPLLAGEPVVIAGLNAPRQTVVSGPEDAISRIIARARERGVASIRLPVTRAFHSPLVAGAVSGLAAALDRETWRKSRRVIVSTTNGARLEPGIDDGAELRALLCRQVTAPVRFTEALAASAEPSPVDLWLEVGPGRVLTGLVAEHEKGRAPAIALDSGGPSLVGLLNAVGAAFVLGASVSAPALFQGRFTRRFEVNRRPRFFTNPCERAPLPEEERLAPTCLVASHGHPVARGPANSIPTAPGIPAASTLELVRDLLARRSELPVTAVEDHHHLLSDLHLNSISVGQLVSETCRQLGLPVPLATTRFADATVAELAEALGELETSGEAEQGSAHPSDAATAPAGIDTWVRAFTVALVERPRDRPQSRPGTTRWQVLAPDGHPLADALGAILGGAPQPVNNGQGADVGVMVCLPPDPTEEHVGLLLEGAHRVLAAANVSGDASAGRGLFVLVQHGGGAASFARSLHLEARGITTCVVDLPADLPESPALVVAEADAASGYTEVHYDAGGRRYEPVLRLLATENAAKVPILGPDDVLLVTGGGKGIAAECALVLARESGARLLILGRSRPSADAALAANLDRFASAGIDFRYESADVTDAEGVRAAVSAGISAFGPITAVLHAAGVNEPRTLARLDEPAVFRTLAPKLAGLRHVLASVDEARLRLLVTFGSIIARSGMRGEADYALANEWLTRDTERFAARYPGCRCLALEWSVWSGVGMGERLGSIDRLVREGIAPIPTDLGIAALRDLVSRSLATTAVIVTSRFGAVPTLRPEPRELPFLRFLERPRVHVPGVELVIDVELTSESDPYLEDHAPWGECLFPAVMGLEAMAQAASALIPSREGAAIAFEAVRFDRPVAVPHEGRTRVRLAALVRAPGRVEVALRCESTGFQVDHFHALCVFEAPAPSRAPEARVDACTNSTLVALDPGSELYGTILFQSGRFRRLQGYRQLAARECLALVAPGRVEVDGWFGRYLPPDLLLGDPAARDAFVHSVQGCIPHRTLLPVGVDRLEIEREVSETEADRPYLVHAVERSQHDETFTYDLEVRTSDGRLRERWRGLRLRAVEGATFRDPWPTPLLGPYVERRVRELIVGSAVAVVVRRDVASDGDPRVRTERALEDLPRAVRARALRRRPDGRPEFACGDIPSRSVSAAHAGSMTLVVAGCGPLGADIEPQTSRTEALWSDLLGPERFRLARWIARESSEDLDRSATRVWAASECLIKAGVPIQTPLILDSRPGVAKEGWICLAAGELTIATVAVAVSGEAEPLVLAVAARSHHAPIV